MEVITLPPGSCSWVLIWSIISRPAGSKNVQRLLVPRIASNRGRTSRFHPRSSSGPRWESAMQPVALELISPSAQGAHLVGSIWHAPGGCEAILLLLRQCRVVSLLSGGVGRVVEREAVDDACLCERRRVTVRSGGYRDLSKNTSTKLKER